MPIMGALLMLGWNRVGQGGDNYCPRPPRQPCAGATRATPKGPLLPAAHPCAASLGTLNSTRLPSVSATTRPAVLRGGLSLR